MEKNLEKEVSDCCGVAFHVEGSDEGTNHYECNKCHQSCDTVIRPAPSQPSMEVSDCCGASYQVSKSTRKGTRIFCNECGEECTNLKSAPKKEKESTEVRDEKIARIKKEFREKFTYHPDGVWNPETARIELPEYIPLTIENVEAWLTQTLTTLLNEE